MNTSKSVSFHGWVDNADDKYSSKLKYASLSRYVLFLEVYALLIQIMKWVRFQSLPSLIWRPAFLSFDYRQHSPQHKLSYEMNTMLRWNNSVVDQIYIKFIFGFMCVISYLSWTQGQLLMEQRLGQVVAMLSIAALKFTFETAPLHIVGWNVQTLLFISYNTIDV